MKHPKLPILLPLLVTGAVNAQVALNAPDTNLVTPYQVVKNGPHERVWKQVRVDAEGVTNVHSYHELATGLNYLNSKTGAWEESREEFEISPDGYAIASK